MESRLSEPLSIEIYNQVKRDVLPERLSRPTRLPEHGTFSSHLASSHACSDISRVTGTDDFNIDIMVSHTQVLPPSSPSHVVVVFTTSSSSSSSSDHHHYHRYRHHHASSSIEYILSSNVPLVYNRRY